MIARFVSFCLKTILLPAAMSCPERWLHRADIARRRRDTLTLPRDIDIESLTLPLYTTAYPNLGEAEKLPDRRT